MENVVQPYIRRTFAASFVAFCFTIGVYLSAIVIFWLLILGVSNG